MAAQSALVLQPRFDRSARKEGPGMTNVSEAEGWARGLDELADRLAPRFGRVEPRRRALAYLRGLLAPLGRKNGWQLAEAAGDRAPDGMQDFLSRMRWDADAVRDDLRAYVVEHLGDPGAARPGRGAAAADRARGAPAALGPALGAPARPRGRPRLVALAPPPPAARPPLPLAASNRLP